MAGQYITPDSNGVINYTITNPCWILVHNGPNVINFKEFKSGTLSTKQKVYVSDTEAEGKAIIDSLKTALNNPNNG